jgi:hypothetical protein
MRAMYGAKQTNPFVAEFFSGFTSQVGNDIEGLRRNNV